ncbi:MAG: hypothetical protein ACO3FJ_08035, partial [Ilumatobacteraceae bacterium]
ARDAAFGGTGEKTLAEGQFCYLEDSDSTQYYSGSSWQAVGAAAGLTLVKTQTIGSAVNTVTVTNAFNATYDNYMITISGGVASATFNGLLQLGATTTNYYSFVVYGSYSGTTVSGQNTSNGSSFGAWFTGTTNTIDGYVIIKNPFLTKRTTFNAFGATAAAANAVFWAQGFLDDATSYTDIKFLVNGADTMTGGEIRIYGMANS